MRAVDGEAELIRRLAAGDEGALEALYRALGRNVFALALRMTGNREDAEELVQDTFVTVHAVADRFDPERGSAQAWVYAIARNACRSRLRARRARSRAREGMDVHDPASAPAAEPRQDGAARLTVQEAFARLSAEEARLLEDAFYGGYSHAEIARREGAPLGTIKSRIRRAMLKARVALGEAGAADLPGEEGAP